MRLKPGRPDLRNYARYFDVPEASPDAPLTVTWAGVTTLLIDDGASAVMTDGFFSRPSLATVGLGRIAPSASRIDDSLQRMGVDRLEAVLPVHTHFDHAMDSAAVAQRTGDGSSAASRRHRSASAADSPKTARSSRFPASPSRSAPTTSHSSNPNIARRTAFPV